MNNYAEYKAEDFAIDPDFIQWVLEKKQADDEFWRQWLQVNPQKKEIIEEARNILLSLKIKEKTIGPESLNREIEAIILKVKKRSSKGIVPMLFRWKYAAMLAGLVLGAYMVYDAISSSRNDQGTTGRGMPSLSTGMAEVSNTSSQVSSVSLPDGSHVRLFPGAIIRYSHHLASNETRDLYLSGEAFFEVAKDSGKPFRVFSHELVTRVLGTSFTIKANEKEKQISVMVRTGIVSVYNKDKENNKKDTGLKKLAGVVLTANQQLVYAREQHQFQKSLIEQPLLIHPAEIKNNFLYEDVSVADVLEQLNKAYSIDIIYDKEIIKNCRITADLTDVSIYKKLDLICRAMEAGYTETDGQIIIEAKPCK